MSDTIDARGLGRLPIAAFTLDGAGRLTFANEAAFGLLTALLGAPPAIGARLATDGRGAAAELTRALHTAIESGIAASLELGAADAGTRTSLRLYPSADGLTALASQAQDPPPAADQTAVLDSIREIFIACDAGWRVTYVNARAEPYLSALGLSRSDLVGRVLWSALPFLAGTEVHDAALRVASERRAEELEVQPGSLGRWFAVRISPAADGVVSYSRDITERKGAEGEIRRLNRDLERRVSEFQTLLDVIPMGIAIALTPDGRELRINRAFAELMGIPPQSVAIDAQDGSALTRQRFLSQGRELEDADRPLQRALRGVTVIGEELDIILPEGRSATILCSAAPLFDDPGRARGAVGTFLDISGRRRQERAQRILAEASAALNSSLDYALTLAAVGRMAVPELADYCLVDLLDDSGQVQRVEFAHRDAAKQAALRETSFTHAPDPAWTGHPISEALRSREPTFIPEMTPGALDGVARDPSHLTYLRALGCRSLISAPLIAHGRTLGALTFCFAESGRRYTADDLSLARDLAARAALAVVNARLYRAAQSELGQRAQAEADLRKWAHIFEHAGWGVVIVSADGMTLEAVNPAFARMHGYEPSELVGQRADVLLPEGGRADVPARMYAVRQDGRRVFESTHIDREGREMPVLVDLAAIHGDDGTLLYYAANVQDLSERRRAEEQVRQAQKMEAVGRLAGGVAHDFNNMLMIIIGFADFLCHALEATDPRRRDAEEIRKAAGRAAGLTRQLLAFGRQQLVRPQLVDLNSVVRDMEQMLRPLLGEDIALVTSLPPVGAVRADRGQLEQVIMNLALNARDAMADGGRLVVETRAVAFAEGAAYRQFGLDMPAGDYVRLVVRDTGQGMDADTKARIFEPFFTTKPPAQNSGLGLAVVYGIVSQNGGQLWVESQPHHGTSFTIWLPRVADHVDERPTPLPGGRGGTERILVVEDEAAVRALAARSLAEVGYTVMEASSGREALELVRNGADVDAVLSDVVMPVMGGRELAEQLHALRPGLPILFMSGYTGTDMLRRGVNEAGVPFLQKPFSPGSLTARIRELLDAS